MAQGTVQIDPQLARQSLVSVYRGWDEQSVRRIQGALLAQSIRATVRCFRDRMTPWLPNDPMRAWGEVLVLEQDAQRAVAIIEVAETGAVVSDDAPESEGLP